MSSDDEYDLGTESLDEEQFFTQTMHGLLRALEDDDDDPSQVLRRCTVYLKEALQLAHIMRKEQSRPSQKNDHLLGDSDSSSGSDTQSEDEVPQLNRRQVEAFVVNFLPKIIDVLLMKRFPRAANAMFVKVNQFFQNTLYVIVDYLNTADVEALIQIYNVLFARKEPDIFKWSYLEPLLAQDYAILGEEAWRYGAAYVDNINAFGHRGGFDALLARLKSDFPTKPSIYLINALLQGVTEIRALLSDTFAKQWIPQVKDVVFSRFLDSTEQELKDTNKLSITKLIELMGDLLQKAYPSLEAGEMIEKFRLSVALKCLSSVSFEKRLNGIMELNELVEMVMRREANQVEGTVWLDAEYLINWIKEHQILSRIFGAYIHSEMLKRSVEIFVMFSHHGEMDDKLLDLLWDSSLGKQETIVDGVHKIIKQIAPLLPPSLLDHLFVKMKNLPASSFDTRLLALVKRLLDCVQYGTVQSKEDTGIQWRGLEILWKLVQDDSKGVSADVRQEALAFLIQAIQSSVSHSMKETFLLSCIENLKNTRFVPPSLDLLKKIIATYPMNSFSAVDMSRAKLIQELQSKHKLLHLVLEELFQFKAKARGLESRYLEQSSVRLAFLNFLVAQSQSSLTLTREDLDNLWENLIIKSPTEEELNQGFAWFKGAGTASKNMFTDSESIYNYILTGKLGTLDPHTITPAGFDCFHHYFRNVNVALGTIAEKGSDILLVQDFNLVGLDTLWRITLKANNQQVAKLAATFLNRLYDMLSPSLRAQREQLNTQYLQNIINSLKLALQEGQNSENIIERCIATLTEFVRGYDKKYVEKKPLLLNFILSPISPGHSAERHQIPCFSSSTIGEAKQILRRQLMLDDDANIKISSGILVLEEDRTVAEYSLREGATLYFRIEEDEESEGGKMELDTEKMKKIQHQPLSPSMILSSNEEFFDLMFDLMEKMHKSNNKGIANSIFELVFSLPLNPQITERIHTFAKASGSDWSQVFNTSSMYKLQYSFFIIEKMIDTGAPSKQEDISWRSQFVATGGFAFVYKMFITEDALLHNPDCLASLLNIVTFFLGGWKEQTREKRVYLINEEFELLKDINLAALVDRLLTAMGQAGARSVGAAIPPNGSIASKEEKIVRFSMVLLIALVNAKPELLHHFFAIQNFKEFMEILLLKSSNKDVRTQFALGLFQLANLDDTRFPAKLRSGFISLLSEYISTIDPFSGTCTEYFELFLQVLSSLPMMPSTFWASLWEKCVAQLRIHPTVEIREDSPPDSMLVGLLEMLSCIVTVHPTFKEKAIDVGLLDDLFKVCLFKTATQEMHGKLAPPMAKTASSRCAAFNLLRDLAEGNSANLMLIREMMYKKHILHMERENYNTWNFSAEDERRSSAGYVGLKNLGCTCYMNSLLQQLFMMPKFRTGILSLPRNSNHRGAKDNGDNSGYFLELQAIMCNLQESQKRFFDPRSFVETNRDYEGNPINIYAQMDVDEYFNMMCEKLDEHLKGSIQEKLLQNIWCGKLSSQLICKGCPHRSERDDPFYVISLDIKDKASIQEALELYVKGEMLEGDNAFKCEKCNTKRDTLKRSCVKTLPNTLILHLKRFEFDFDTMRKVKLNDHCEFPMQLNMEPYTTLGIAKRDAELGVEMEEADEQELLRREEIKRLIAERSPHYYDYNLVGVLVHRGSSESGHYYSFIKERVTMDNKDPRWIEFNDKIVKDFDVSALEDECFGGAERILRYDPNTRAKKYETVEKSRNAYMLIYERNHFLPSEPDSTTKSTGEGEEDALSKGPTEKKQKKNTISLMDTRVKLSISAWCILFIAKVKRLIKKRRLEDYFTVSVPKPMLQYAWRENEKFLKESQIFSNDYFTFIRQFIQLQTDSNSPNPLNAVSFTMHLFFWVFSRAKAKSILPEFMTYFCTLLQESRAIAAQIIESNFIHSHLVFCPVTEVRVHFGDLLSNVCAHLGTEVEGEDWIFEDESDDEFMQAEIENAAVYSINRIVSDCVHKIGFEENRYRFFDGMYYFFSRLIQSNEKMAAVLLHHEVLNRSLRLFMQDEANNAAKLSKRKRMKIKGTTSNYPSCMAALICRAETDVKFIPEHKPATHIGSEAFPLSDSEKAILRNPKFIFKLIRVSPVLADIVAITQHWMWENEKYSLHCIRVVSEAAHNGEYSELEPIFIILSSVLAVQDSIQVKRINHAMMSILSVMYEHKGKPKKTREFVKFLTSAHTMNELARLWLDTNKEKWHWVQVWIDTHPEPAYP